MLCGGLIGQPFAKLRRIFRSQIVNPNSSGVGDPTSYGTALDLRMTMARWGRRTHARERSADGPIEPGRLLVRCWSVDVRGGSAF